LLGDQQGDMVKTPKGQEQLRRSALKGVSRVSGRGVLQQMRG